MEVGHRCVQWRGRTVGPELAQLAGELGGRRDPVGVVIIGIGVATEGISKSASQYNWIYRGGIK